MEITVVTSAVYDTLCRLGPYGDNVSSLMLLGKKEIDARFSRFPPAHGLRHFKSGISGLARVSGAEHKNITKQLLGCMSGAKVPGGAIIATRALLDFLHIAQYECHSDDTLQELRRHLDTFHEHKEVFINLGLCDCKLTIRILMGVLTQYSHGLAEAAQLAALCRQYPAFRFNRWLQY